MVCINEGHKKRYVCSGFPFFPLLSRENEIEKIWRPFVDRRICAGMFLRYEFALRGNGYFFKIFSRQREIKIKKNSDAHHQTKHAIILKSILMFAGSRIVSLYLAGSSEYVLLRLSICCGGNKIIGVTTID